MNTKIETIYDDIAFSAFNNFVISRENDHGDMEDFRLSEIEIYMIDKKNNIDDLFIHKNEKQKEFHEEYIHYSGFDICMGDNDSVYCGILVRGLMNDKESIYGPGRVKYNHKNRKKIARNIKIKYDKKYENKLYFSDSVIGKKTNLEDIIFKLPRVNLANSTSSKYLVQNDIEELDTYLNLKARYIRIKDEKFHKLSIYSPEEPREIFNALIQYKTKIANQ